MSFQWFVAGRGADGPRGSGAAPPELNDFPPAGEAGGKIISDSVNDFITDIPAAGEAGEEKKLDFQNPKFIADFWVLGALAHRSTWENTQKHS